MAILTSFLEGIEKRQSKPLNFDPSDCVWPFLERVVFDPKLPIKNAHLKADQKPQISQKLSFLKRAGKK